MAGDRYGVGIVGRRANSKECGDAYAMFDGEAEAVRVGAECWFGRSGFGRVMRESHNNPSCLRILLVYGSLLRRIRSVCSSLFVGSIHLMGEILAFVRAVVAEAVSGNRKRTELEILYASIVGWLLAGKMLPRIMPPWAIRLSRVMAKGNGPTWRRQGSPIE